MVESVLVRADMKYAWNVGLMKVGNVYLALFFCFFHFLNNLALLPNLFMRFFEFCNPL